MTPYLNVDDLVALRNRLTECQHDPTFRADNEANGGAGCPRCNQKRVVMVQHADGEMEVEPCWIVNPVVTMQQPETISVFDAEMRRLCADYEPVEPDYPGMWK